MDLAPRDAVVAAAQQGVPFEESSAPEIKRAACGYGAAGKDQIVTMMTRILGLDGKPTDDEADAMATAWCHLNRSRAVFTEHGAP